MANLKISRSALALIVVFLFAHSASGDEELNPAKTYVRCSPNGQFCAEMNVEKVQTIVRQGGREIWRMEGWFEDVYLADDGNHLVVGYEGLSLLPIKFSPRTTIVTFYRRGELIRKVYVSEIIRDLNSLPLTGSHRLWGRTAGFDKMGRFIVRTVEDRAFAFDVTDGSVIEEWSAHSLSDG
jgi:hypothetical protein